MPSAHTGGGKKSNYDIGAKSKNICKKKKTLWTS